MFGWLEKVEVVTKKLGWFRKSCGGCKEKSWGVRAGEFWLSQKSSGGPCQTTTPLNDRYQLSFSSPI
jgi:hypothetical protein